MGHRLKKHRITLDVPSEFNERLDRLLEKVDANNKADLIRQALRVYEYIVEKKLEGCEFKIVYPSGEIEGFTFLEIPRQAPPPTPQRVSGS
jgi:hypothetical protein